MKITDIFNIFCRERERLVDRYSSRDRILIPRNPARLHEIIGSSATVDFPRQRSTLNLGTVCMGICRLLVNIDARTDLSSNKRLPRSPNPHARPSICFFSFLKEFGRHYKQKFHRIPTCRVDVLMFKRQFSSAIKLVK